MLNEISGIQKQENHTILQNIKNQEAESKWCLHRLGKVKEKGHKERLNNEH